MGITQSDIDFATELFLGVPNLKTRKMMGGLSLYSGNQIFSIVDSDGQIFLKAAGQIAKLLESEGAQIFAFTKKDGSTGSMGYWSLPEPALDDPEQACDWAQKALDALT